jgi:hypothetical protein
VRAKRAKLPGKDILFGGPAQDGPAESVVEDAPASAAEGAEEPPEPVAAVAEGAKAARATTRRAGAERRADGEGQAHARRPAEGAESGGEAARHVQLCAWIDPAINDELDRLRARLLIDRGAKVTKSQVVEFALREALSDGSFLERMLLL